jgi:hypothetical protein
VEVALNMPVVGVVVPEHQAQILEDSLYLVKEELELFFLYLLLSVKVIILLVVEVVEVVPEQLVLQWWPMEV